MSFLFFFQTLGAEGRGDELIPLTSNRNLIQCERDEPQCVYEFRRRPGGQHTHTFTLFFFSVFYKLLEFSVMILIQGNTVYILQYAETICPSGFLTIIHIFLYNS